MTYPTIVGIQFAEDLSYVTTGQIPIQAGNPGWHYIDLFLDGVNLLGVE